MPVRMRGPAGQTVDVAEADTGYYQTRGFTPLSTEQEYSEDVAAAAQPDDRGVLGSINAAATGLLAGATLGASDALLSSLATKNQREQINQDRLANPGISTAAEIVGGIAPSIAAPGSALARTPTGVLSGFATRGVESARALGGIGGFAGQAAITGAEAAAQNVGSYLGSVALGDHELTAEGLGGALGSGFAFGAAGGAAVYGIEKGTIAARRMFSSVMDGGEDAARSAAGNWERRSTEIFDANRATLDEAKRQLDEAIAASQAAKLEGQRAGAYLADERVLAQQAVPAQPPLPVTGEYVPPMTTGQALDNVLAGPGPKTVTPGPEASALDAASRAVDDVSGAPVLAKPAPLPKTGGPTPSAPLADAEYQTWKRGLADTLPPEDLTVLSNYTKEGLFGQVNGALREIETVNAKRAAYAAQRGNPFKPVEIRASLKPTIDQIDGIIARSAAPRDLVVYRGYKSGRTAERISGMKPGESFVDNGFGSTSMADEVGAGYAKGFGNGAGVRMEITVPKGHPLAPVPNSEFAAERELLLPRNSKYTIESIEEGADGHTVVRARIGDAPATTSPPGLATKIAEAEDAESALMRALQGTKAQIDEGATLGQVGTAANARPLSKAQLESQYDAIVERAAQAADIETKQALLRQASALEEQLGQLAPSRQALSEIDSVTQAMSRYERAMADVAEEMGDAAHPLTREIADSVRKAESDVDRKMFDRAAQAIDDHAAHGTGGFAKVGTEGVKTGTQQAGGEVLGPQQLPAKERIAYAKARKLEADATAKRAAVAESEARAGYKAAKTKAKEIGQAARTIGLPSPIAAEAAGGTGRALDVGGVLELAGMAGIPGLPRPSDLPIVGPLIGLYLKARAIGGVAGRLMGRVPASGNAKAATLAAQVKDRAAHAVDRMLGHVDRATPTMRTVAAVAGPRLVEAVRDRLHDDGTKAPAKDASLQEHVAARSREITALVADPALIAKQVRKELRDVADPDMVNAAIAFRTNQLKYLERVAPKEPSPGPFQRTLWKPPRDQATDFARRYAVAMDPVQALEQVEQKCLTPEAAEAYRAVYPKLFAQTQMRLIEKATALQTTLPRTQLTRMSILFDLPLDSALEPGRLSRTQSVFAATGSQDQAAPPPTGPVASIAGPTNLSNIYQTVSDRRAAMR